MKRPSAILPERFQDFGGLLKFLRRRAGLTQRELSAAIGYSDSQISRMEAGQRVPDAATLSARFVPALQIGHEPEWVERLLELAATARRVDQAQLGAAPSPVPSLLDRIARGRLIGRQGELARLQAVWARARQGHAHLALISGEAGIGKTRLARELQEQVGRAGAAMLSGGCYEYDAVVPYLPFIEALREWAAAQTPAALRDQLGATAPELARLVPEIAERLGPLTPSPSFSPNEDRLRLFDNLARFFQARAAAGGLLIFLDDLHWADQGTLALLHYVLRRLRGSPLLILAAYRPVELDRAHPLSAALVEWDRERLATRVALDRLAAGETGAMLAALFTEDSVSSELTEAIHRETDGNPFFIEETVKSLIEQGDIYRLDSGWDRKAISELAIPESVKDAIGRRLARLSPACLELLHTAAVLGKFFRFSELAPATGLTDDQVLDALDEAGAAQLLRVEAGEVFAFTHDKIRQVLYEELNPVRRRRVHQRLAEGLEKLYASPELAKAHIADIAHHFIQGSDLPRGLTYSLEAAAQAQRLFALDEAVVYFRHAAECAQALGRPEQLADTWEKMGDVHFQRGVVPTAVEHYQQAQALLVPGDRARRAVLNMKIGDAYAQIGDERGPHFLQLAESGLDPVTQVEELANTIAKLGRYHHYQARHRQAIKYYERARRLAEAQPQARTLGTIYTYLAGAYQHLAQLEESQAWARQAIALGEHENYPEVVAVGHEFLSENAINQGRWQAALESAARDQELGEKIGALNRVAWGVFCRMDALYGHGNLRATLAAGQAALALAEQIGEARVAVLARSLLARVETDLGQAEAARTDGEMCLAGASQSGQIFLQCLGRHGLAYHYLHSGEWEKAAALYERCAAIYRSTENRVIPLMLGPYPAEARLGLGQVDQAAQLIADYLALAREAGAHHPMGCALRVQGQIFAAQGAMTEATEALDESIAILDGLASRLELGRALYRRGLVRQSLGHSLGSQEDWQRALALFQECEAHPEREQTSRKLT